MILRFPYFIPGSLEWDAETEFYVAAVDAFGEEGLGAHIHRRLLDSPQATEVQRRSYWTASEYEALTPEGELWLALNAPPETEVL